MRIWILSDIHVDFVDNQRWLEQISALEYRDDALILAGDVTHNFELFQKILKDLRRKFKHLFFAPGNHDLWIRGTAFNDSLEKFEALLKFCQDAQITMEPALLNDAKRKIGIIPIFSWYHLKQETGTLYLPKPGEEQLQRLWSDFHFVRWPNHHFKPVEYFVELNGRPASFTEADLIITFSHFLPRQETMFSKNRKIDGQRMKKFDRLPQFNFSQVAGSTLIEKKLRQFRADIHVYGHQHINRDKVIDGVRYVSHCLGYPEERRRGTIVGIERGLKCIG
ncbi:metallophosphoesterase family protein [Caldithrix abyssi]